MTSVRPSLDRRILVLSASFGGPQADMARTLAAYLKGRSSSGVRVQQVDFLEQLMPKVNVLAKFGYQQPDPFFPGGSGDLAHVIATCPDNPVVQVLAAGGYTAFVDRVKEWRPDAVISLLPLAAAVASEAAATLGFTSSAVLTDFSLRDTWLHPDTAAYFVPSRDVRDALVVAGVGWGRITVSGVPICGAPLDTGSRAARRRALGLADRFTCVLATPSDSTSEVLEIAQRTAASGIQVAVGAGAARRFERAIAALSNASGLVRLFGAEVPASELVGIGDVVVSRPGATPLYEALSLRTPVIIYNPVPGQELLNVDYLVNCGAALLARDGEDACEKLRYLATHPDRLAEMAAHAGSLGKADSTRTICERVLAFTT